ncbi:putative nucleotide-diphospho-sugar transferase [Neobacillus sp. OS1-2]|uniref:putative nucleotide-diphospho-sugar transferase n=1 Tax=Neobacillus sp. OS1-2 TaxID=3070680 RepID=UPI0027E0F051|nr:putative nucleotide-diphospho-sugar transferase [Neobacillus sp. OS1-2]WML39950.1 putative nucleotide-diphospho-sugar transferase [Neobacillus sp. OS1-2]
MDSVYCTIITKSRLYQVLALIVSLDKVRAGDFQFFVLCVDDETYNLLIKLNWKNVHVFHESEIAESVVSLRKERKIHEYCWTLKAIFLETILTKYTDIERITFMDSDLYFLDDPEKIFNRQPNCSVLLSREEKYKPEWKRNFIKRVTNITGEYNSGFISFRRDKMGIACLNWWKEKTIEACKIDPKRGIFGDQKYLNEMPKLFSNICDIELPGVNIGPWNYLKYSFSEKDGYVYIDQCQLIFYHFSGVRIIEQNENIELIHSSTENTPFVFSIYHKLLTQLFTLIKQIEPGFNGFASEEDLKSYW